MKEMEEINVASIAKMFAERGFQNTSNWLTFALETKIFNLPKDFGDVILSLRDEIRRYKQEYYDDPDFKEACFDIILKTIFGGMTVGPTEFRKLTGELIPLTQGIIEANKVLEDLVNMAEKLDRKSRFYMLCFYYLVLCEGSYRNVLKNLLAMKRVREGKNVTVCETLGLMTDEGLEKEEGLKEVLPDRLKKGNHGKLRNAIAHLHFRYLPEEEKMEFWDIDPRTYKYTLNPTRLTYGEFSRPLLEVNFFCEIFGFCILLSVALSDIAKRRS